MHASVERKTFFSARQDPFRSPVFVAFVRTYHPYLVATVTVIRMDEPAIDELPQWPPHSTHCKPT
jgi:hypothetical protein